MTPREPGAVERTTLSPRDCAAVLHLLRQEQRHSGRWPLDETHRLALTGVGFAADTRFWLVSAAAGVSGFGVLPAGGVGELTADSAAAAESVLTAMRVRRPALALWTHGDRSRGRAAAQSAGLAVRRELLLLGRPLAPERPARPLPAGCTLTAFDRSRDETDWLAVNAAAFADLPDQGSWTTDDLALRLGADWFRASDLLLCRDAAGNLAGFHWLKIDPAAADDGEVFVIAVAPSWQGTGLGGALLDAGLAHLRKRGMSRVHLFVDAGNTAAVALYERAGFARIDSDRMFASPDSSLPATDDPGRGVRAHNLGAHATKSC